MKLFDTMILDIILITFPLMVFLLFLAYTKTFNKKENDLLFVVTIFSILYLILKYTNPLFDHIPFLIINVPLILSYVKKSNLSVVITSLIMISYYYSFFQNFLLIIIIEYIIYYLLYIKLSKKLKPNNLILIFSILKTGFIILINTLNYKSFIYTPEIITSGLFLYVLTVLITYLLNKTEDILKLHMNIKEIERNKQIKTSLFRITHEIKNPIAVCKGYLDMFDTENPTHFKKYIPILKDEINRTLLLLEDFLAMNKVKINKDIIDINLLIEEVIKNINMLCNKNNIKLKTNIIDDDIYINADYNRLTQVFINILKNSVEAIPKNKKGIIEINEIINTNQIIITIKDNGVGMNQELLNKIKEPFYTTKPKGTGLGVSLSEEIINAHNGTLNYQSEENKYTKVTITLPIEPY